MKVLILNSDSPKNRGDRAILAGNIELVREQYPDAEIWSLSQYKERDEAWFGIRFHEFSPYSVSPIDFLKLLRAAMRADLVLWGGGEILKDYTNRLSLFYWLIKISAVSMVTDNLVGAFQGIGPTSATLSKKVIAATINRCRTFLVRDEESKAKLIEWGVDIPIISSFDPAVYCAPDQGGKDLKLRIAGDQKIDVKFLDDFVGFGLRRWFHYRQSGWLPASMKPWVKATSDETQDLDTYITNLATLADKVIARYNTNIVFFPMHVSESENDPEFALQVIARMKHGKRTHVIRGDAISPSDYLALIGQARFFIASRLHSAILATVANVPSLCLYYVDKGRLFFEQMGLQRFSADINVMLEPGVVDRLMKTIDALVGEGDTLRKDMAKRLKQMRKSIRADLEKALKTGSTRG